MGCEYSSPVPLSAGGKTLLVLVAQNKVFAIDPKNGHVAWAVEGGDGSSVGIVGEDMAVTGERRQGLMGFKLTGREPEKLWTVPFTDVFTSPVIHEGHVYAFGEAYSKRDQGRGMCVDMATGDVKWNVVLGPHQHASAVVADGKLLVIGGSSLYLVKATPEKYTELGKLDLGLAQWSSPALVDGKVFLRTRRSVVCYDLRK
jgi:outer membrane protein assembly factor BamB